MADYDDDYRRRISELEAENEELRRSAQDFGELAERLNMELRNERRRGQERRARSRPASDRRILHFPHR